MNIKHIEMLEVMMKLHIEDDYMAGLKKASVLCVW
jgi:hypothetical protein